MMSEGEDFLGAVVPQQWVLIKKAYLQVKAALNRTISYTLSGPHLIIIR